MDTLSMLVPADLTAVPDAAAAAIDTTTAAEDPLPVLLPEVPSSPSRGVSNESPEEMLSLIERLAQLSVAPSGTSLQSVEPQTGPLLQTTGGSR